MTLQEIQRKLDIGFAAAQRVQAALSPSAGEAPSVDAVRLSPDAEIKELKSDLQQFRDRHEALVSALKKFGQHKADCECVRSRQFHGVTLGEGGRCTCGFRAALAKAGA